MKNRTTFLILIIFSLSCLSLPAQEIITGADFFGSVSDRFATIESHISRLTITMEESGIAMSGTSYFIKPDRLHIVFDDPAEQVINVVGNMMTIYIPSHQVTVTQEFPDSGLEGAMINSEEGLSLLQDGYGISFVDSPDPVPLEEGSEEMVTMLRLTATEKNKPYPQVDLCISEDLLIRRIIGINWKSQKVQFDYTDMQLNVDIPDSQFEYESPDTSWTENNFIFDPEG